MAGIFLGACGSLDSTVGSNTGTPCRDEAPPTTGRLFVRYSDPHNYDKVLIWLDPRDSHSKSYSWNPSEGTQSDVIKGLSFTRYWVTARYVRGIDTVDVFDSQTIEDGENTNSAGCRTYNPESTIDVRLSRWPS